MQTRFKSSTILSFIEIGEIMIFINFYFIGLSASIGENLVISMEIKYRNHVKKENECKDLTLSIVSYLIFIDS